MSSHSCSHPVDDTRLVLTLIGCLFSDPWHPCAPHSAPLSLTDISDGLPVFRQVWSLLAGTTGLFITFSCLTFYFCLDFPIYTLVFYALTLASGSVSHLFLSPALYPTFVFSPVKATSLLLHTSPLFNLSQGSLVLTAVL